MPFDFRKFRENNKQELIDEHKQLFESLRGGMNRTALNAYFAENKEMNDKVMNLVYGINKAEIKDDQFEKAKKYVGSSYEFNDILMKGDASELYQKATRDKGQDLWSHFDGIRQKTKALKESVKSDNKTLGTEFGKAATVLGNNGK